MKFHIIVELDEDGKYMSSCPALPGCWSQGETREEATTNITDAIKGYLASLKKHGDLIPPSITDVNN